MSAPPTSTREEGRLLRGGLDPAPARARSARCWSSGAAAATNASQPERRASRWSPRGNPRRGWLAVSRALNPECEHIQGRYGARLAGSGVSSTRCSSHDRPSPYMTTEADLRMARSRRRFVHCHLGRRGALSRQTAIPRDVFQPSTDHGGRRTDDNARAPLSVVGTWDPDPGRHEPTVTELRVSACALPDGTMPRRARPARSRGCSFAARPDWAPAVWPDAGLRAARDARRPLPRPGGPGSYGSVSSPRSLAP